jgi:hypothetical protein
MGRRRHRRPDLDSPLWWAGATFVALAYLALLAIWLVWAFIALPIAGIAKLRHNDALADQMVRSLVWKISGQRSRR